MDRVRIAIIDANNKEQLAFMDNGARDALHYYDDILHTYLQGSAYTFECKVEKDHPDAQFIQAGNKLSFVWKQMPYNLTIMRTHEDESCIELTAYACCFELLNETAIAYTASSAMTLAQYLAVFLPDNDFVTVGINEASSYTRKLEWTGDNDSILKRLYSLASSFDAELEAIPTLNPDYTLGTIVLNFYLKHSDTQQGIGENRSDVVLRYGVDVEGISRDVDVTELYTAILPTGKDGLTLRTYAAQTVLDEDGDVLFTKPANDPVIYAPQARERYPSNVVAESDRYIMFRWDTEYSTQAALYGNALAKLKSICEPKATYEVRGYTELNIGDTVMIVDNGFDPVLYLSARVVEQQISFTDKSQNETTFDNVTEMVSQIDDSLLARVQELASQVAQSAAGVAVQYYVSTSPTELIGDDWSTESPTWEDGSYIWTRMQFTANNGAVTYSNPACSTGAAGEDGQPGDDGKMLLGKSTTASATPTKIASLESGTLALDVGATVQVTFAEANTADAPTLNVGGTGAIPIRTNGVAAAYWEAGGTVIFAYDGTYWQVCSSPVYASTATVGNPAGGNVYLDSDSVDVRDGADVLASFERNGIKFNLKNLAASTLAKLLFYDEADPTLEAFLAYSRETGGSELTLLASMLLLVAPYITLSPAFLYIKPDNVTSLEDALTRILINDGTIDHTLGDILPKAEVKNTTATLTWQSVSGYSTATVDLGDAPVGTFRFFNGVRFTNGAVSIPGGLQGNRYLRAAVNSNRNGQEVTFEYIEITLGV